MTTFTMLKSLQFLASCAAVFLLVACATLEPEENVAAQDVKWLPSAPGKDSSPHWHHKTFLGKKATSYSVVQLDGRKVVQSNSDGSASMLRQALRVEPGQLGKLRFSWKVPFLIEGADMAVRETDDSPVRVILAFEGDRAGFSAKNAMLSELAHALTGEPLPYATLMYVWGNHSPPGTVVINSRTDRIRKMVIESGPGRLNRWADYERDIAADYRKAFGEEPGALVGIAIMTDSDNTRQTASAWFGPLTLVTRPVAGT